MRVDRNEKLEKEAKLLYEKWYETHKERPTQQEKLDFFIENGASLELIERTVKIIKSQIANGRGFNVTYKGKKL